MSILNDIHKYNVEILQEIISECKQILYGIYTMSSGTLLNFEIENIDKNICKDTLIHISDNINYLMLAIDHFNELLIYDNKNKEFILKNSLDNINKLLSPILKNQNIVLDIYTYNQNILFTNETHLIQILLNLLYFALKDYRHINSSKNKTIKIEIENENNIIKILFYFEIPIKNLKVLSSNLNNIKKYQLDKSLEINISEIEKKTILSIKIKN